MKPNLSIAALVLLGTFASGYWLGWRTHGTDAATASGSGSTTAPSAQAAGKNKAPGGSRPSAAGRAGNEADGASDSGYGPAKHLGVKDIFAKVKALMRGGSLNNPSVGFKVVGLLAQISDADVPAALAMVEDVKEKEAKMMFYMALLSRMAEKDGAAAMAYAEEKLANQGPMVQMSKMGILASWAESDPEGAWGYYQKHGDEVGGMFGGKGAMLMPLFSTLAAKDQAEAFRKLSQLTDSQERQMALNGMAQAATDEPTRLRLMEEIGKIADADERKSARTNILGSIAMNDPDQAMALVRQIPGEERKESVERVGMMLMMSEPAKGAAFMLEMAEPKDLGSTYGSITSQWARMDPKAAGNWLNAQPQGPELDGARAGYSRTVMDRDPSGAMAWAATIEDANQRADSVRTVYEKWKKKDAAAAEAALGGTGLSPEQIEKVRAPNNK